MTDLQYNQNYRLECRLEELSRFIKDPCFPSDFHSKNFHNFDVNENNKTAFDFFNAWNQDDFGFLIMGPSGTGKSYLMFALIHRILETMAQPENLDIRMKNLLVFVNTAEFLEKLKKNFDEDKELDRCKSCTFLFLDDLGVENITDWSRDQLYRLFEYRLNQRLATFVSTNLSLDELKNRMHERVLSRLKDLCVPVTIGGYDRRNDTMKKNLTTIAERVKKTEGA